MKKGKYIVFEGINGAGKTTQIKRVTQWLGRQLKNTPYHVTREPGGTILGDKLREIVCEDFFSTDEVARLLLFFADRAQHFSMRIIPALDRGEWVLSDRDVSSSFAYQCAHAAHPEIVSDRISTLLEWVNEGYTPDIKILIDVSPQIALQRVNNKGEQFADQVAKNYRVMAEIEHKSWIVVDGNNSPDEVYEDIIKALTVKFFKE